MPPPGAPTYATLPPVCHPLAVMPVDLHLLPPGVRVGMRAVQVVQVVQVVQLYRPFCGGGSVHCAVPRLRHHSS